MSNRIRLTRIASFTKELDRIADEIQQDNPEIALAIDMVSDHMEDIRNAEIPRTEWPAMMRLKYQTYKDEVLADQDGVMKYKDLDVIRHPLLEGDFVKGNNGKVIIKDEEGKEYPTPIPKGAYIPKVPHIGQGKKIKKGNRLFWIADLKKVKDFFQSVEDWYRKIKKYPQDRDDHLDVMHGINGFKDKFGY